MASLVALMAPNIRFSRRIARSPLFARGLMVEIIKRKRNVRRHALQHRDDLSVDRSRFVPRDDEYADALAVTGQRQCRRGAHLGGLGARTPRQRTLVVQEIVADAYLLVAKGLPANSGTLGGIGHDRNVDAAQAGNVVAAAGGEAQEIGCRIEQEDGRGQEVPAGKRGFADLLVQLFG